MADDALEERLRELSRRIDADLGLYEGGLLAGSSTPVLEDLGVMPVLMDPGAFVALALEGELELTREGAVRQPSQRVGYRVVEPGFPSDLGVLATPQPAEDPSLAVRRLDLALVLLLATLLGVAAALAGAGRASRALSRPVAELRRSAIALGKGDPTPLARLPSAPGIRARIRCVRAHGGRHQHQSAGTRGGTKADRGRAGHRGHRGRRARSARPGADREPAGDRDPGHEPGRG